MSWGKNSSVIQDFLLHFCFAHTRFVTLQMSNFYLALKRPRAHNDSRLSSHLRCHWGNMFLRQSFRVFKDHCPGRTGVEIKLFVDNKTKCICSIVRSGRKIELGIGCLQCWGRKCYRRSGCGGREERFDRLASDCGGERWKLIRCGAWC